MFQRFSFRIILQIIIINALGLLLIYFIKNTQLWFTIAGLSFVLIGCFIALYNYTNQIREDIKLFVLAIKNKDHTLNFKNKSTRTSFPELYDSFVEIIQSQKDIQLNQDAIYQLIKNILEQIQVGIIVIKKNKDDLQKSEISFFNQAASNLLNVPQYSYWKRFKQHIPIFSTEIEKLFNGGKSFLELKIEDKPVQLSIKVIPITLYGAEHIIVSFQNIKDEIEQKEAEAWNRLIGVISHEILNSITPISSLSDTVNQMIINKESLSSDDLEDLKPAIQTIKRRSTGLLDFVKDYRLIAELPTPQLQQHSVGEIFKHIKTLMLPLAASKHIKLKVLESSSKISINVDFKLIEQALINLITNSMYAVGGLENPTIEINYRLSNNKVYIDVTDNGKGIEAENIDKIFVPFYTTRTNGSGIGLTITRNIMKMHQGALEVISTPNLSTTFSLVFNYL